MDQHHAQKSSEILRAQRLTSASEEKEYAERFKLAEIELWSCVLMPMAIGRNVIDVVYDERQKCGRGQKALFSSKEKTAVKALENTPSDLWEQACVVFAQKIRQEDSDRRKITRARAVWVQEAKLKLDQDKFSALSNKIAESNTRVVVARNDFVAANTRLVGSVAVSYAKNGLLSLPDLIQEGNFGLIKAVEQFDHTRGYRFSTYASLWIKHKIRRAIDNTSRTIRVPSFTVANQAKIKRKQANFFALNGRKPSNEELVQLTGLSLSNIIETQQIRTSRSLDEPAFTGHANGPLLIDTLEGSSDNTLYKLLAHETMKTLTSFVDALPNDEAYVIRERFLNTKDEKTLKEIGKEMVNPRSPNGLSRERIRQIEENALSRLKEWWIHRTKLASYSDCV